MRLLDFSSWQAVLTTVASLAFITLMGVGVRLVLLQTIQQRRERENRQINERLRTLIAAYKVLGGSFTGSLVVDPTHLKEIKERVAAGEPGASLPTNDRARRIRDAVEAALSDVMLLGTEEQVKLAAAVARELVAGRPVETAALVASLRGFVREALDLDPVPTDIVIPPQGPTRPSANGRGGGGGGRGGGDDERGGRGEGRGGGGMAMGGGMGMGVGLGLGHDDE